MNLPISPYMGCNIIFNKAHGLGLPLKSWINGSTAILKYQWQLDPCYYYW